jgi:hypothetical protein
MKMSLCTPLMVFLCCMAAGAQSLVDTTEIRDTNDVSVATSKVYAAPGSGKVEVMHIPSTVSYDILANIPDSTRSFVKYLGKAKTNDIDSAIVTFACRRPITEYAIFSIDDRTLRTGELRSRNMTNITSLQGVYIVQVDKKS